MKPTLSPPPASTLLVLDALDLEATAAAERMGDAIVLQTLLRPDAEPNELGDPTGAAAHVRATLEYAVAVLGVRRVVVLVGASSARAESLPLTALLAARYRTLVNDPHVERLVLRSRVVVTCVALVDGVAAARWSPGDDELDVGEVRTPQAVPAASPAPHRLRLVTSQDHAEMG